MRKIKLKFRTGTDFQTFILAFNDMNLIMLSEKKNNIYQIVDAKYFLDLLILKRAAFFLSLNKKKNIRISIDINQFRIFEYYWDYCNNYVRYKNIIEYNLLVNIYEQGLKQKLLLEQEFLLFLDNDNKHRFKVGN